jgi:nucleoside-diphosphate-sugar epimerase
LKILLTGSNGFLGKYIYEWLSLNHQVYRLCRSQTCDFRNDLAECIPSFSQDFEIVVHAAGKAHSTPKNNFEIDQFNKINVQGTLNLLKGLTKISTPKYFVFISSVSVYGLSSGLNISENSPLLANDPYGISKINAEKVIINWCDEHNVKCTILRLPIIVGINPPGNLGDMIKGLKRGYYFNIAGGNAKKSMVLASDVSKFILNAARTGGIFNLTDGKHPSFNELSNHIAKSIRKSFVPDLPYTIAKILGKIGDILGNYFPINSNKFFKITSTLTFDDSKARDAFGWAPVSVLKLFKLNEDV